MKPKTIIHLLIALFVLGFTATAAHAAATKSSDLGMSPKKLENAKIISAAEHAYFRENAVDGKKCDPAKTQALVIAFAKHKGAPAGSYAEAISYCEDQKIITSKSWRTGKNTGGKNVGYLIIKIARHVK